MSNLWRCLEAIPGLAAVPATWRKWVGADLDWLKGALLRSKPTPAKSFPCPRECGCAHEVVEHKDGSLAAVCQCEPWNCDDIPLTAADVTLLELNWSKLGRAIAKGFGCDAKQTELGIPGTMQVAAFSGAALPIVLTIQSDRRDFRNVTGQLVAKLRERFVLLAPTSRFMDAHSQGLLAGAKAGFFDLESHLTLTAPGGFQSRKSAGELFSPYATDTKELATDNEACRLFALLKALDTEGKVRKAPVIQVFRLYCLDGFSRAKVAKECNCAESLVTLRLQQIEKKLGRKPAELRQLSSQFERIADSLSDSRAKRIHRRSAMDQADEDEGD